MDFTRRQFGRLAAAGTGALVLPGLLPPGTAVAAARPAGTWGDHTIRCLVSGKVLDVSGGSTADGAALIQYRDTGGSNQRWTFHRVTD